MSSGLTKAKATVKALIRAGHDADDVIQRVASGFRLTEVELEQLKALSHPGQRPTGKG